MSSKAAGALIDADSAGPDVSNVATGVLSPATTSTVPNDTLIRRRTELPPSSSK